MFEDKKYDNLSLPVASTPAIVSSIAQGIVAAINVH